MSATLRLQSLLAIDRGAWRHPWHTSASWNVERGRWEARVKPGLINGIDPTVRLRREEWPRGYEGAGEVDEVPLAAGPAIGLAGYRVPEPVPEYFLARGVQPAKAVDASGDLLEVRQEGLLSDAAKVRQLRACDLVLVVDRLILRTEWTFGATVDGITAQYAITLSRAPSHYARGRVVTKAQHVPVNQRTRDELLRGNVATDGQDQKLLATVYLLSAPGAGSNAVPDGTWEAHVAHDTFWNLRHGSNLLEPPLATQNLTLNTGLAGGLGDPVNNWLLAQINDLQSAASQFLGRNLFETRWWTA